MDSDEKTYNSLRTLFLDLPAWDDREQYRFTIRVIRRGGRKGRLFLRLQCDAFIVFFQAIAAGLIDPSDDFEGCIVTTHRMRRRIVTHKDQPPLPLPRVDDTAEAPEPHDAPIDQIVAQEQPAAVDAKPQPATEPPLAMVEPRMVLSEIDQQRFNFIVGRYIVESVAPEIVLAELEEYRRQQPTGRRGYAIRSFDAERKRLWICERSVWIAYVCWITLRKSVLDSHQLSRSMQALFLLGEQCLTIDEAGRLLDMPKFGHREFVSELFELGIAQFLDGQDALGRVALWTAYAQIGDVDSSDGETDLEIDPTPEDLAKICKQIEQDEQETIALVSDKNSTGEGP